MRLLLDPGVVCRVAEEEGRVVGCGLGVVAAGVGWIYRTDAPGSELSLALVEALDSAFADAGARLVAAVSNDGAALVERGFRPTGAALFDRELAEVSRRRRRWKRSAGESSRSASGTSCVAWTRRRRSSSAA